MTPYEWAEMLTLKNMQTGVNNMTDDYKAMWAKTKLELSKSREQVERLEAQAQLNSAQISNSLECINDLEAELARYQWQSIETAPHGKNVLLAYKNCLGKRRVVKAAFLEKYSVEENSYDDFIEFCDYHEERDTYYWPEGWYEQIDNWDDLSAVAIDKGNIERAIGWMPLPAPPEGSDE